MWEIDLYGIWDWLTEQDEATVAGSVCSSGRFGARGAGTGQTSRGHLTTYQHPLFKGAAPCFSWEV